MKKIILLIVLGIFFCCDISASLQVNKKTFIYSIKGDDTLRLDKYEIPSLSQKKSCVIFVFGGGFRMGSRDSQDNAEYMRQLAKKGYVSIAIDYRLGMKDVKSKQQGFDPVEIVNSFEKAISIAVEDLFDATNFVLDNSEKWNIDKGQIIANGSSAGAITVLQAEYDICIGGELSEKLPDNFNYGGIIAFAGAIFSVNGDLEWKKHPAPIMMFHGDRDSNVPYDKIKIFNLGLYGSKFIAEQLQRIYSPYYFYDVRNAAHEIAGTPREKNLFEIDFFIRNYVIDKKSWRIHTKIEETETVDIKKEFELMDYIKSNFI